MTTDRTPRPGPNPPPGPAAASPPDPSDPLGATAVVGSAAEPQAMGQAGSARSEAPEPPELRRLRRRIDALDRRIVALLNERAKLALAVGQAKRAAGWRAVRDLERERDVLDRVAAANTGPLPEAALLAVYRRVIAATRALEARRNGLDEEA
ncbi:MAG TPA: chorismate mutase [Candidatus Binatia bacterium]|nr:chorismate mutase [Candidatus Binatia bacterium]